MYESFVKLRIDIIEFTNEVVHIGYILRVISEIFELGARFTFHISAEYIIRIFRTHHIISIGHLQYELVPVYSTNYS